MPFIFFILFFTIFWIYYKSFKKLFNFFIYLIILVFILEGTYYFYGIYNFRKNDNYYELRKLFSFISNSNEIINNSYDISLVLNYYDNKINYGLSSINFLTIISDKLFFNGYDPLMTFDKKEIISENIFPFYFNLPISLYSIKQINIFYSGNEYKSNQILDNFYNNFDYIYNINYDNYVKLIKVEKFLENKEKILNSNHSFEFEVKNYSNSDIIGVIIFKIKLSNRNLLQNYLDNYYNILLLEKRKYLNILIYDNNDFKIEIQKLNLNYIKVLKNPNDEYIKVIVPFSYFDIFDINAKKTVNLKIKLNTNEEKDIHLKDVKLVLYPPFFTPVFNKNIIKPYKFIEHRYLRKKISYNNKSIRKLVRINSIIYNNNYLDIIRSVNKVSTYDNFTDFKENLYLLNFNILNEAQIEKTELEKLKKYSQLNNLNYFYKDKYKNINQENIKEIYFAKSEIRDINIFKKYNEISFKAKTERDSFIVVNHGYYKYWKAYVDNIEVPVLKTNVIVMGIIIPKGEHNIVLKYEPWYAKFFFLPFATIAFYLIILIIIIIRENKLKNNLKK
jgi:hypothetical protein